MFCQKLSLVSGKCFFFYYLSYERSVSFSFLCFGNFIMSFAVVLISPKIKQIKTQQSQLFLDPEHLVKVFDLELV